MAYKKKATKNLKNLKAKTATRRSRIRRVYTSGVRQESAAKTIGKIEPGCEIFGFTKGQFSLIDVLEHCLKTTGPADVFIATWSAAAADIAAADKFLEDGRIKSLKMLIDYSFKSRKPEFCKELVATFGPDAVRVTVIHAKFITVYSYDFKITIRTSMNFNFNPRFETFEISDDPGLYDFIHEIVDEIWKQPNAAEAFKLKPSENVKRFKRTFREQSKIFRDLTDARDLI